MGAERGFGKAKFVVSLWGIVSILFSAVPLFGAPEKQIKKKQQKTLVNAQKEVKEDFKRRKPELTAKSNTINARENDSNRKVPPDREEAEKEAPKGWLTSRKCGGGIPKACQRRAKPSKHTDTHTRMCT